MAELNLQLRYTRTDPSGHFPRLAGHQDIRSNRLGVFWRPLLDGTDSEFAPMILRFVQPVAGWIADPTTEHRSWFAMLGVPGVRHQVVRHAGLGAYDSPEPSDLSPELRSPVWSRLVEAIDCFEGLEPWLRTLVVFQLAQLSYMQFVLRLVPIVEPAGEPEHDRYAYEVARVHSRYPGGPSRALPIFRRVCDVAQDPVLALLACFQGISYAIRSGRDADLAHEFEERANELMRRVDFPDAWEGTLAKSRLHRSVALLRMTEHNIEDMWSELDAAMALDAEAAAGSVDGIEEMVSAENRRILVEAHIKAAARFDLVHERVDLAAFCEELVELDPYCVQARMVVGDGYAALDDYATAAAWYSRAGELGSGTGALAWFRAGQCFDFMGDRWSAANAMAHCLELDTTAVEPEQYLAALEQPPLVGARA